MFQHILSNACKPHTFPRWHLVGVTPTLSSQLMVFLCIQEDLQQCLQQFQQQLGQTASPAADALHASQTQGQALRSSRRSSLAGSRPALAAPGRGSSAAGSMQQRDCLVGSRPASAAHRSSITGNVQQQGSLTGSRPASAAQRSSITGSVQQQGSLTGSRPASAAPLRESLAGSLAGSRRDSLASSSRPGSAAAPPPPVSCNGPTQTAASAESRPGSAVVTTVAVPASSGGVGSQRVSSEGGSLGSVVIAAADVTGGIGGRVRQAGNSSSSRPCSAISRGMGEGGAVSAVARRSSSSNGNQTIGLSALSRPGSAAATLTVAAAAVGVEATTSGQTGEDAVAEAGILAEGDPMHNHRRDVAAASLDQDVAARTAGPGAGEVSAPRVPGLNLAPIQEASCGELGGSGTSTSNISAAAESAGAVWEHGPVSASFKEGSPRRGSLLNPLTRASFHRSQSTSSRPSSSHANAHNSMDPTQEGQGLGTQAAAAAGSCGVGVGGVLSRPGSAVAASSSSLGSYRHHGSSSSRPGSSQGLRQGVGGSSLQNSHRSSTSNGRPDSAAIRAAASQLTEEERAAALSALMAGGAAAAAHMDQQLLAALVSEEPASKEEVEEYAVYLGMDPVKVRRLGAGGVSGYGVTMSVGSWVNGVHTAQLVKQAR